MTRAAFLLVALASCGGSISTAGYRPPPGDAAEKAPVVDNDPPRPTRAPSVSTPPPDDEGGDLEALRERLAGNDRVTAAALLLAEGAGVHERDGGDRASVDVELEGALATCEQAEAPEACSAAALEVFAAARLGG